MTTPFFEFLAQEFKCYIAPLRRAAESEISRNHLFLALGVNVQAISNIPNIANAIGTLVTQMETLQDHIENPPANGLDALELVADLADLFQAVRTLPAPFIRVPDLDDLGVRLIRHLTITYLQKRANGLFLFLAMARLFEMPEADPNANTVADPDSGRPLALPDFTPRLRLDQFPAFLLDPLTFLKERYFPIGRDVIDGFREVADYLDLLFTSMAATTTRKMRSIDKPRLGQANNALGLDEDHVLYIDFYTGYDANNVPQYTGFFMGYRTAQPNPGLYIEPRGNVQVDRRFDDVHIILNAGAHLPGIFFGARGISLLDPSSTPMDASVIPHLSADLQINYNKADNTPAVLIGEPQGNRLEIGTFDTRAFADVSTAGSDYGAALSFGDCALVLGSGNGDGFVQSLLPDGLEARFNLGIGWSKQRGTYLEGGAGLSLELPINRGFPGFNLNSLSLQLDGGDRAAPRSDLDLNLGTNLTLELGPVTLTLDGLGLSLPMGFREGDGNLGLLDLSLPSFKPPTGIGIAIDAGPISGGGFLFFDEARGSYSGALELNIYQINAAAVGILSTRLPDGRPGFSLIVSISASFPPIQLGLGFTLNGIGGLAGIHRSVEVDQLRQGVRTGSLDNLLFPRNIVASADRIISDLERVFPSARNQYVFGPVLELGWGTPTLIQGKLGVLLQLPSPTRLIILGQLKMGLPNPNAPLIDINLDALGVIDFTNSKASLDASLHNSRVGIFPVEGDMAMRLSWGRRSGLVFSIGGFNPRFNAPANFPELRRAAISLGSGSNPRITLSGYLALTSNTAQVGAALDLLARKGRFRLEGHLGFDALFQFTPFMFVVDISARAAIKRGRRNLLSVGLSFTLSGPSPWRARGRARFKILFIKVTIRFNVSFGEAREIDPPVTNIWPQLQRAIQEPRAWQSQVPTARDQRVVRQRPMPAAESANLIHPLGSLAFTQRVVPLNMELEKFGNAVPGPDTRFDLSQARIGGEVVSTNITREAFAPGSFLDLTEDEKFSRPAFEELPAGASLGAADNMVLGRHRAGQRGYEETFVDEETKRPHRRTVQPQGFSLSDRMMRAGQGASGGRFAAKGMGIRLNGPSYTLADKNTLNGEVSPAQGETRSETQQTLNSHLQQHPEDRNRLRVVQSYEEVS